MNNKKSLLPLFDSLEHVDKIIIIKSQQGYIDYNDIRHALAFFEMLQRKSGYI